MATGSTIQGALLTYRYQRWTSDGVTKTTSGSIGTRVAVRSDWSRTDSVKRHKPKPADLIKNVTSVSQSRLEFNDALTYIWVKDPISKAVYHEEWKPVLWDNPNPLNYITLTVPFPDSRLRDAIKNQKVNLAVFSGEFRETCSMFSQLASFLVDVYRKARQILKNPFAFSIYELQDLFKRIKKHPERYKDDLVNLYLAYRYGVRPLISDLQGALEHVNDNRLKPIRGVVTAKAVEKKTRYINSDSPGYGSLDNHSLRETISGITTFRAIRLIEYDSSIREEVSLGLRNPGLLVYELIPFSFVFDWVFNVGNVISGWDALEGVLATYGYDTAKTVAVFVRDEASTSAVSKHTSSSRAWNPSVPPVTLRYSPSSSLLNVLDGLALLQQLGKK